MATLRGRPNRAQVQHTQLIHTRTQRRDTADQEYTGGRDRMARLMRDRKRDTHGSAKIHTLYTRNHTSQGRRGTLKRVARPLPLRSCSVRPLAPIAGAPHGSNLAHRLRLQLLVRLLGVGPHGVLCGLIEIVRRVLRGAEPSASASGELLADQGWLLCRKFGGCGRDTLREGHVCGGRGKCGRRYQCGLIHELFSPH